MKAFDSAANAGFLRCPTCALVSRVPESRERDLRCGRCGHPLHVRKPRSIERTSALLVAACVLYPAANLLPIVHMRTVTSEADNTIMSGVVALADSGSWPLAALVFFASIFVPLLKLAVLGWLTLSIRLHWRWKLRERAALYRFVEFIGRWSMLDVFVVALLTALVQIRGLATIEPRAGALAFAAVVILTMYAAQSLDARLLWDGVSDRNEKPPRAAAPHG